MSPGRDETSGRDDPTAAEREAADRAAARGRSDLADSLRESETRFRVFTDSADDGIVFHEGERILYANTRFQKMVGYSLAELEAIELLDLVVEGDRRLARQRIAEGATRPCEMACRRKDGSTFPVSVRAGDINYEGTAARVVWIRDLSDKAEVLGALRRSENRYRQLFETCPEGIYVANTERRFIAVNPAMVELFGYDSARAMLEVDPEQIYVDPAVRESFIERLFAQETVRDFATVMKVRDERLIEVLETANLVRDEKGTVVGYQGILRDVTEQRQLERQLLRAQKMEVVGNLAGGVAHDFNNLLTAITGFSELALEALEPDHRAVSDLQEVRRAAERANRLTEQLLSFGRRQAGSQEVVDLNRVATNLLSFLERSLGSDIEIVLDLAQEPVPVRADVGQLEQVLMNLAINARAAMPDGGRLEIRTRRRRIGPLDPAAPLGIEPGEYSLLLVEDDGCGMDGPTRERAFDPFFTTKEEGEGTGLGLATVYSIVEHSGGQVWVDSAPGEGARFTVCLPVELDEPPAAELAPQPQTPSGGSETVLLVEDDESVREFSRRSLEAAGYSVLVARDASEARHVFDRDGERISAVVTDVVMPRGNGVALAREIRQQRPATAILLVSGFPDRALAQEGGSGAEFPLLAKPFTAEALTGRLRGLLDA